jgi:queuine tRNA-ribosyltransferase subunit QTRTD1
MMKFVLQSQSTSNAGALTSRLGRIGASISCQGHCQPKAPLDPQSLQFPPPPFEQPNAYDAPAVPTYFPDTPIGQPAASDLQDDVDAPPTSTWSTPNYLQYTNQASIPHICWTLAHRLAQPNAPILIPLGPCLTMHEPLTRFGRGIKQFARIPNNSLCVLSPFDPLRTQESDTLNRTTVSVWSHIGRKHIDSSDYHKLIDAFKPDLATSLLDTSLPKSMSDRQALKYFEKADKNLEQLIGHGLSAGTSSTEESEPLKTACRTLASIPLQGESRLFEAALDRIVTLDEQISGYCLFDTFDDQELSEMQEKRLKTMIDKLPKDKPRIVFGCLSPTQIVRLTKLGFDLFDNSFCTHSTNRHEAILILSTEHSDASTIEWQTLSLESKEPFNRDFTVLDSNCDCYTCRHRFTRSYICHLATAQEMQAKVLLQLHNIRTYDRLFERIRSNTLNYG